VLFIIPLVLFALLSLGALCLHFHLARYALVLNGQPLVALASKADDQNALKRVRVKYAPTVPGVIVFGEGEPTIARINPSMIAHSPQDAAKILTRHLTVIVEGYAICVNRKPFVLLDSKESAGRAIALMLQQGMDKKQGVPTIKQRVTIVQMSLEKAKIGSIPIMTPEQAATYLAYPAREQSYTVKSSDSFWSIATAHHMTVSELDALNPGTLHILHVGDKLRLPDKQAPITVVIREM